MLLLPALLRVTIADDIVPTQMPLSGYQKAVYVYGFDQCEHDAVVAQLSFIVEQGVNRILYGSALPQEFNESIVPNAPPDNAMWLFGHSFNCELPNMTSVHAAVRDAHPHVSFLVSIGGANANCWEQMFMPQGQPCPSPSSSVTTSAPSGHAGGTVPDGGKCTQQYGDCEHGLTCWFKNHNQHWWAANKTNCANFHTHCTLQAENCCVNISRTNDPTYWCHASSGSSDIGTCTSANGVDVSLVAASLQSMAHVYGIDGYEFDLEGVSSIDHVWCGLNVVRKQLHDNSFIVQESIWLVDYASYTPVLNSPHPTTYPSVQHSVTGMMLYGTSMYLPGYTHVSGGNSINNGGTCPFWPNWVRLWASNCSQTSNFTTPSITQTACNIQRAKNGIQCEQDGCGCYNECDAAAAALHCVPHRDIAPIVVVDGAGNPYLQCGPNEARWPAQTPTAGDGVNGNCTFWLDELQPYVQRGTTPPWVVVWAFPGNNKQQAMQNLFCFMLKGRDCTVQEYIAMCALFPTIPCPAPTPTTPTPATPTPATPTPAPITPAPTPIDPLTPAPTPATATPTPAPPAAGACGTWTDVCGFNQVCYKTDGSCTPVMAAPCWYADTGCSSAGCFVVPQTPTACNTLVSNAMLDGHAVYVGASTNNTCAATLQPDTISADARAHLSAALAHNPFAGNDAKYQPVQPLHKGGLCAATYYNVTSDLLVWRVFHSQQPHTQTGSWWNLRAVGDTVAQFDAYDDVCSDWYPNAPADRRYTCYIKAGTSIAVGPGQSILCPNNRSYPQSPVLQVYVDDPHALVRCSHPERFPRQTQASSSKSTDSIVVASVALGVAGLVLPFAIYLAAKQ